MYQTSIIVSCKCGRTEYCRLTTKIGRYIKFTPYILDSNDSCRTWLEFYYISLHKRNLNNTLLSINCRYHYILAGDANDSQTQFINHDRFFKNTGNPIFKHSRNTSVSLFDYSRIIKVYMISSRASPENKQY